MGANLGLETYVRTLLAGVLEQVPLLLLVSAGFKHVVCRDCLYRGTACVIALANMYSIELRFRGDRISTAKLARHRIKMVPGAHIPCVFYIVLSQWNVHV